MRTVPRRLLQQRPPATVADRRKAFWAYVAELQQASRHYARRQWIWFRREPAFVWVDAANPAQADVSVLELLALERPEYDRRVRAAALKRLRQPFEDGDDDAPSDGGDRADADADGGPPPAQAQADAERLAMRSYTPRLKLFASAEAVDALLARMDACLAAQ